VNECLPDGVPQTPNLPIAVSAGGGAAASPAK